MNIRLNWGEWECNKAAEAIRKIAEDVPPDEAHLECLLVLSRMHQQLLTAAEDCKKRDVNALRQEYDI